LATLLLFEDSEVLNEALLGAVVDAVGIYDGRPGVCVGLIQHVCPVLRRADYSPLKSNVKTVLLVIFCFGETFNFLFHCGIELGHRGGQGAVVLTIPVQYDVNKEKKREGG
jgi:hypothetical protein